MNDGRPPTYLESLKIGWLLTWRLSLVALALGVAFGFVLGLAGALLGLSAGLVTKVAVGASLPLTIFAGYPLVVRMLLRKRFDGFRVRLVPDEAASADAPAEPFGGPAAVEARQWERNGAEREKSGAAREKSGAEEGS